MRFEKVLALFALAMGQIGVSVWGWVLGSVLLENERPAKKP